jgi:acetolactate synthase-1/2/3 large subunit
MRPTRRYRPRRGVGAADDGSGLLGAVPAELVRSDSLVLISAFGDDGRGGLFAFDGTKVEEIDTLSTTGLSVAGGRVARLLRAADAYESTAELLVYDHVGVREYRRLDGVTDPHDVAADGDDLLLVSSAENTVYRLGRDGGLGVEWRASRVHDSWHPNCLAVVEGDVWVTAFGRFTESRGWSGASAEGAGFLLNLRTGAEIAGLTHPHSPRFVDRGWWVCESLARRVVRLDARSGARAAHIDLDGYTRGMAVHHDVLYVGESRGRGDGAAGDASVAIISRATSEVVERISIPAQEVYDVVIAPCQLAEGLRRGFDTNLQRVAEQGARSIWSAVGSGVGGQRGLGLPLPGDSCGALVTCRVDPAWSADESRAITATIMNTGLVPLATVPPHPVSVSSRWFANDGLVAEGPRSPLGRLLAPGQEATVELPVTAPLVPGEYRLVISLVQEHVQWFDDLDPANACCLDVVVGEPVPATSR